MQHNSAFGQAWRIFRARPLEFVVGLAVFVLGFIVGEGIGPFITALGSFLLSYAFAQEATRAQVTRELTSLQRLKLVALHRQIDNTNMQLDDAIEDIDRDSEFESGEKDQRFKQLRATIGYSSRTLLVLLGDIEDEVGEVESPFVRIKRRQRQDRLQLRELYEDPDLAPEERAAVAAELKELERKEQRIIRPAGPLEEAVTCPVSGHRALVTLGGEQGASAHGLCSFCGARFHVHRIDGEVKVGPLVPGGEPTTELDPEWYRRALTKKNTDLPEPAQLDSALTRIAERGVRISSSNDDLTTAIAECLDGTGDDERAFARRVRNLLVKAGAVETAEDGTRQVIALPRDDLYVRVAAAMWSRLTSVILDPDAEVFCRLFSTDDDSETARTIRARAIPEGEKLRRAWSAGE